MNIWKAILNMCINIFIDSCLHYVKLIVTVYYVSFYVNICKGNYTIKKISI